MDHHIKVLVDRYPNLRLQVNLGNRHRIIHRRIDRGSLWVGIRRTGDYVIGAGGDVRPVLIDLFDHYVDPAIGTYLDDYIPQRKRLIIPNITEMANIIRRLGEWHA